MSVNLSFKIKAGLQTIPCFVCVMGFNLKMDTGSVLWYWGTLYATEAADLSLPLSLSQREDPGWQLAEFDSLPCERGRSHRRCRALRGAEQQTWRILTDLLYTLLPSMLAQWRLKEDSLKAASTSPHLKFPFTSPRLCREAEGKRANKGTEL